MEIASQNAKQKATVRGKTGEQRPTKQAEGAAKLIVDFMRKLKPSDFRSDYGKYKDFTDQGLQVELQVAMWLKKSSSFWKRMRFVKSTDSAVKVLEQVKDMHEEFVFCVSFDPKLMADFARHGFLPMCIQCAADLAAFTPKLHRSRSLLDFTDLYVSKNTRKKSKKFRVTVDKCFDFCIQQCCVQHGDHCWFYPALIQSYKSIFDQNDKGGVLGVTLHSIEVWSNDGSVVAGEVGYAVAGVYTSLSGFKLLDSAGTIQLSVVPSILQSCGYDFWDLGMHMDYKGKLGAKKTPRKEFLKRLSESKDKHPDPLPLKVGSSFSANCRELLDMRDQGGQHSPANKCKKRKVVKNMV